MKRNAWPLVGCVVVGACASSPLAGRAAPAPPAPVHISGARGSIGATQIHNDPRAVVRTVAAPLNQVWGVLPHVYEAVGIPQAGADPNAKAFGNLEFRPRRLDGGRLSEYVDCGTGSTAVPRADEYDITMSVRTQLTPIADSGTVVATTVQASGKPRAVSGNAVYCQSLGRLEARIFDLVVQALGGER